MRKPDLACPALLLLLAGPVSAQHVDTGFLDRTVTVAGHSYRYQVYVPADYLTKATWPVILFLHGGGERARTVSFKPLWESAPRSAAPLSAFPPSSYSHRLLRIHTGSEPRLTWRSPPSLRPWASSMWIETGYISPASRWAVMARGISPTGTQSSLLR